METPVPNVPPEVASYLEKIFPDKLPSGLVSQEYLGRLIGQQDVIRKLRDVVTKQTLDSLGLAEAE